MEKEAEGVSLNAHFSHNLWYGIAAPISSAGRRAPARSTLHASSAASNSPARPRAYEKPSGWVLPSEHREARTTVYLEG